MHVPSRQRGIIVALLLSLVPGSVLFAHALLMESVPAADATIVAPPKLVLRFNSRIEARLSSVMLIGGPRQIRVMLASPQAPASDTLVYPLPELPAGQYRAEWKALSVDGHLTGGVLRFTVIEATR